MKAGTRLVLKTSGSEYKIVEVSNVGISKMYKVVYPPSDWSKWYSEDGLQEKYFVLGEPDPQPVERVATLKLGDIFRHVGCDVEVVEVDGDRVKVYCYEAVNFDHTRESCPDNQWWWAMSRLMDHVPPRHRFYIEGDTLKLTHPLKLVDGVHDPLELSIRKWEVLAEAEGVVRKGYDGNTCALCEVYGIDHGRCGNCPVGSFQCKHTPYHDYSEAGGLSEQRHTAAEMVEFLKGLRTHSFDPGDVVVWSGTRKKYIVREIRGNDYRLQNLVTGRLSGYVPADQLTSAPGSYHFYTKDGNVRVTPELTPGVPNPLDLSIQKWEFVVEVLESGVNLRSDGGYQTCALCAKYLDTRQPCQGCPVPSRSEEYAKCSNTPYKWWVNSYSLESARAELAFLKEIRDA